jgi:N-acetylmuramoyl-L-alanine amidase
MQTPPHTERQIVGVEWEGRTKYTFYDDGIVKITRYKARKKIYWGRVFVALIIFVLLIMGIVQLIKATAAAVKGDRTEIPTNTSMAEVSSSTSADESPDSAAEMQADGNDSSENSSGGSSDESSEADSGALLPSYSNMNIKVCLDPGHGDYDSGTVGNDGVAESVSNLEIAQLTKAYLESCGVSVTMTRESDVQVSLSERCAIANQANADFFVSLHRNSVSESDSGENGVEIWVNNKMPEYDVTLANNIMSALDSVGIMQNRGVKYGYSGLPDQNYQVNTDTVMPSCLVELGFVTSDADNELFESKKSEYAKAIGDAIIQTAIELGVADENGTRLLGEQLISQGKSGVTENY